MSFGGLFGVSTIKKAYFFTCVPRPDFLLYLKKVHRRVEGGACRFQVRRSFVFAFFFCFAVVFVCQELHHGTCIGGACLCIISCGTLKINGPAQSPATICVRA